MKQTTLAISTTKAGYISARKSCQQALWMKQALIDYDIRLDDVPIMCDDKGAIDLSKNHVQHSRMKHIEIRHHFILENVQKQNISIEKVSSEENIADILTKPPSVIMPRLIASDHKNTHDYILILSGEYGPPLKNLFKQIENHFIHEGRVVNADYDDMEGHMFVEFVIQNNFFSYTLEEFGQILRIPLDDQCSFTDQWSLDKLVLGLPSGGRYQTDPPCLDEIKTYVQLEREKSLTRVHQGRTVYVYENQVLTREIQHNMKTWVEIICENVFCLGGNQDHLLACLSHMLYCITSSMRYNLACFVAKRMKFVRRQPRIILPYEKKGLWHKKDRHSTSASSSSAFDHPLSLHHVDDDNDEDDEGTSRASTPSPTSYVSSLLNEIPQVFTNPPHDEQIMATLFTRQTEIFNRQVQMRDEHRSRLKSIGKGI
ncbi:hypothetical protein Tco_1371186 [Tanacetum coccineum]